MVQEGLLRSDSPRGIWEISEKGRAYLEKEGAGKLATSAGRDPLVGFIGSVEHGSLGRDIDREVYSR